MKKKIASIVFSIVMGSLAISPVIERVHAESNIYVSMNDIPVQFNQSPMIIHNFTMVPMREMFEKLGAEVDWGESTQTVTATKGDLSIEMRIGSSYAFINYEKVLMATPVELINGSTYVPLRFVSQSMGTDVTWDSDNRIANLMTQEEEQGMSEEILTLEDAIVRTQENSYLLKTADQEIQINEIKKDMALGTNSYKASKLALEMAENAKEDAKDQVALLASQAYQDIFLKEYDVKILGISYVIAQMEEDMALGKYQMGQLSEKEKNNVLEATQKAKQNLQGAKTALENAKDQLNMMMGKPEGTLNQLVDKPVYEEITMEIDLETHIELMISKNPSIVQLEEQLDVEKKNDDFESRRAEELHKINLEMDEASLLLKKKEFGDSLRKMYQNIKQLEGQYQVLKTNLESFEMEASVLKTKYQKGWASLIDVMNGQRRVLEQRKALDEAVIQIGLARYKWKKPWL